MSHELVIIGCLRGLWPLLFFVLHPFAVHFGSMFTDMIDHKVVGRLGYDKHFYALFDSVFDKMYICSALVYLFLCYRHLWRWRVVMAFGVYRLIGGVLFVIVRQHWIPVVFPNAFGWLMLIMTTLDIIGLQYLLGTCRRFVVMVVVVTVTKVVYEVMHHLVFYNLVPLVPAPPLSSPIELWLDEAYVLYVAMFGILIVIGLLKGPHGWRYRLWRNINSHWLAPCKRGRKNFSPSEILWCAQSLEVDLNIVGYDEFGKGMNVELEHGWKTGQTNVTDDDILKTGMITVAHLLESPCYYVELEKMERAFDEEYAVKPRPIIAHWQTRFYV